MTGPALLALTVAARADDATAVRVMTPAEVASQVAAFEGVVKACAERNVCDANAVGADARVGEGAQLYTVHWDWLRETLRAKPEDRARMLPVAAARLAVMATELPGGSADAGGVDVAGAAEARRKLDEVMRRKEFQEAQPTWWQRKRAQMLGWLARIFSGVDALSELGVGKVLQWLLFVGAAAGLLVFVLRAYSRQRNRLALGGAMLPASAWKRDAEDWAEQAEERAAAGDFREALHHLYWAAIVRLESRRMWRHDPTRTPREYVRLLKPGTVEDANLRRLTGLFETAWYGQGVVTREAYRDALSMFEGMSASRAAKEAVAA